MRIAQGEEVAFEELVREHPDRESELLELRRELIQGRTMPSDADTSGSVYERIRRRFGQALSPEISLPEPERDTDVPSRRLLTRLASRKESFGRYSVKDQVAQGGMGAILRVWDEDLRRDLAMKVILSGKSDSSQEPALDTRMLSRFLEEAQVTGQLEHPGVVPVHDLGLDADGHVYFTMQLIKGRDLRWVFEQVHAGSEDWTLVRALGVFIKACETMAFAHSKGVIHRDIKPSNLMVGRFGETYVMDWGLARVLGRPDPHDIRIRSDQPVSSVVESIRLAEREESPHSSLLTEDGVALGTPAYMSPEQARGAVDVVGPRSDVYSMGAMLYHLLAGQVPYLAPGSSQAPRDVLGRVIHGPPAPLGEIAPEVPRELVAIAEKAMARRIDQRYADMMEMARDFEAYLGRRPISAVSQRLGYLLRLAVQRNKPAAMTAAGAFVVVVVALAVFILNLQDAVRTTNAALQDNERLVDELAAPALLEESRMLYPLLPENAPGLEAWLARADRVLARRSAARVSSDESESFRRDIDELARLRPLVAAHLETARSLRRVTLEEERGAWSEAIADIARIEAYRGLEIRPQLGLVPLGRSRHSGLWEFWHVLSGERPRLDAALDEHRLGPETGFVLVLLPGGAFDMGRQPSEPRGIANERLHRVTLSPFLLSKYEVTQAQWQRVMGANPSGLIGRNPFGTEIDANVEITPLNPVETVSWTDCQRFLQRLALALPTEAQWEYACRAGTTTQFCWGNQDASLEWNENVRDQSFGPTYGLGAAVSWDDGFRYHAPVGSFAPSGFGLYDMHGNVTEWCLDTASQDYPADSDVRGDGLVEGGGPRRINRGGSWYMAPEFCRSAFRQFAVPAQADFARGLRVARKLER